MAQRQTFDTQLLIDIAKQHNIVYLALFGSFARAEATADSDIDLYARFGRPVGLFEMLGIKHEMEDALGMQVDLVAEEVVEPYQFMRAGIAKDLIVLLDREQE